jgi:hypothetical protein
MRPIFPTMCTTGNFKVDQNPQEIEQFIFKKKITALEKKIFFKSRSKQKNILLATAAF